MTETKEIVLTGGPCAGKTTGLNFLAEKLRDKGFRVLTTPEVATMFILGGVSDISQIAAKPELYLRLEEEMLLLQIGLRKRFNALADIFKEPRVIIFDRGEMDIMAYVGRENFYQFLEKHNLDICEIRDSYSGVIHLVTAAIGAEKFYSNKTNRARQESLEAAKISDGQTMDAWFGQPHLKIIDNSTDFEGKMKRLFQASCRLLGIPVPVEIERKFLLKETPDFRNPYLKKAQKIFIEQMYLKSENGDEIRIRKRSQDGSSLYYRTKKIRISPGVRHETESSISGRDYEELRLARDLQKKIIRKNRYCFAYNNQYFELDFFKEPVNFIVLEIELTEENDKVEIPEFLKIEKEVTGDESYSNFGIASK